VFGPCFGIGPQRGITGIEALEEQLAPLGVQGLVQHGRHRLAALPVCSASSFKICCAASLIQTVGADMALPSRVCP
jgi:hypothetical protein